MRYLIAFLITAAIVFQSSPAKSDIIAPRGAVVPKPPPVPPASGKVWAPAGGRVILDSAVDSFLSALSPNEHAVMRKILLLLPTNVREHVIYYDTSGNVYATDPSLKIGASAYKPVRPGSQIYSNPSGAKIVAPPDQTIASSSYNCASIPTFTGSGPYREVLSKCGIPYDYSQIYIPCNYDSTTGAIVTSLVTGGAGRQNDTGYAYLGGFSSNGNAVDAGLQYSELGQNWALFIKANGTFYSTAPQYRLRCNQVAQMNFYPASTQFLAATEWGYDVNGNYRNMTIVGGVFTSNGWSANACYACVVKRVTSIGQSFNGRTNENLSDNSLFGINFTTGQPEIDWSNADVGAYCCPGPKFYIYAWNASYTGGYITYPYDPSKWHITFYSPSNEIDGVYLHS